MNFAPRKSIRLNRDEYVGKRIYFVTVCTEERQPVFQDAIRAPAAINELKRVADRMNFLVYSFCLMPDHAHFLVEGKTPKSDLVKFVAQWKQGTGYLLRNELHRGFWQRRFYDHVLRKPEHSEAVAWYIWMNPVRKGIVTEAQRYPFSGSFTVEWPPKVSPADPWSPPWKPEGTR